MERKELLGKLISVSKQMTIDKSWPVSEFEVLEYYSSSFEFGLSCGVLWQREQVWHRGDEFKDIAYIRKCKKVIGNRENKEFGVGDILEVEDGHIDILNEDGSVVMCLRAEDTWAYIEDILPIEDKEK